jgi:hypothetical protein
MPDSLNYVGFYARCMGKEQKEAQAIKADVEAEAKEAL